MNAMPGGTTAGHRRGGAGRTVPAALCAVAALCAMAVAGCGGSDAGTGDGDSSAPHPAKRASSSSPRPSPSVTAADGSDPRACSDGNCEIAVSEPVTVRFEIAGRSAKLSLSEVGRNKVAYKVTSGSSRTSGEAGGEGSGCVAVFRSGGSSSSCGAAGEEPPEKVDGAVVLQVASGPDGTAVLRLVS
ncbi:hypothetical protein FM076_02325 [Streptomyces albus subsp. chlorinus]|uniref:hypothetical protein n=1 Tax=Streptomyces albus TaxID=1888 RepID=UPI0015715AC3|nr:hypothetical protein [Streptomyces albus]NSC20105.1 hypothetical protein [Streptomyces albus subsp. chlorinus]